MAGQANIKVQHFKDFDHLKLSEPTVPVRCNNILLLALRDRGNVVI